MSRKWVVAILGGMLGLFLGSGPIYAQSLSLHPLVPTQAAVTDSCTVQSNLSIFWGRFTTTGLSYRGQASGFEIDNPDPSIVHAPAVHNASPSTL